MDPLRTCIGCRAVSPQTEMRRFVRHGDHVVDGTRPRAQGRGAYLHPDPACLDLAIRRRAFARALGAGQTPEGELRALMVIDGDFLGSRSSTPTG